MKNIRIKTIFLIICIFLSSHIKAEYFFVSNENSDTITVLNSSDKKIVKTIKTGGRPRDMKFSLDKELLYVVVSEENHIAVISLKKLEVIEFLETGDDPEIFDISPDGSIIAVSNEDDNELTLINLVKKEKFKVLKNIGVEPEGVNFSPNGKYIYVTSEGTNSIIIINTKSYEVENEILVGNRPRRGVFVKNGKEYWVSNELNGSVSIIDTKTQKVSKEIKFSIKGIRNQNITPVDFAYSNKNKKVYVTLGSANHVAIVDVETYNIEKYILAGARVWGAALTADEKELIVTNGNSDDITIINLKKLVASSSVAVGKTPHTLRVLK